MARISAKETLDALKSSNPPKLAIVGSAKATVGRTHFLMKLRPSTLKRLQAVALGPQYLLQEYAVLRLCEELEAIPQGMVRTIDAASFNASPEDIAEVEAAQNRVLPGRVVNRTRKIGEPVWPAGQEPVAERAEAPDQVAYTRKSGPNIAALRAAAAEADAAATKAAAAKTKHES